VHALLDLALLAWALRLLAWLRRRQRSRSLPSAPVATEERVMPVLDVELEQAIFDYWRAALEMPEMTTVRLDWQLWHLERFVLPPLGHLTLDALTPRLLESYAVLISSELPPRAVEWTCEALTAVIAYHDLIAGEQAKNALELGRTS